MLRIFNLFDVRDVFKLSGFSEVFTSSEVFIDHGNILLESGDSLLTESGNYLILE